MKIKREKIDADVQRILDRLHQNGFEAFVVGGAIRDLVMGNEPKDFDVVTDAGIDRIASLFEHTIPVGSRFGMSLVVLNGRTFEVAQFRQDGIYRDGRRPAYIRPATAEQDVKRRDFTINALIYDGDTEEVVDHVSGLDDIRQGIIRTIGDPDVRFAEDRLRMLRAIRFAARFGFTIEPATMEAIKRSASTITDMSPERIGQELGAMFSGSHPDRALDLLDTSRLLATVLPEVAAMKGVAQPPQFHPEGDVYVHTREMLRQFGSGSVTLGFGILLHDVGKPLTQTFSDRIRFNGHDIIGMNVADSILKRLRFPNDSIDRVRFLVGQHSKCMNAPQMRPAVLRRFILQDGFDELLELYRLDCLASHGNLDTYEFLRERMAEETFSGAGMPTPLLNGDDLITLGYQPGPLFSTILAWVYDEQLEGRVSTKDEATRAVRAEFPEAAE
ncbi:CCA tRNA nucleotidyltransferase [Candidatus Latescibacterota bacterium]